ncbi:cysteine desulfurase family protein [Collimonas pratensis]|uniref:cysteine desulfurase n=1 Tax=Collimonas pratensis TaxID=279113 RepID=A0A127QC74_9BURK|nr:cysteine desulfurase family protein [Collimonas pratensis]AMP07637.1 aminotransferase class-V family protein [Collimonas pratensis]
MIYLDNNATTRTARAAIDAMQFYFNECYFNASTSTAAFTGADRPREDAAAAMATLLNAEDPTCFIFTSGATESNNWLFAALEKNVLRGRVIVSAIEHPSISEPATAIEANGFEVLEVPVDDQGVIRLDLLEDMLTAETRLVSIMAANNETGVLQPISEIGRLVRRVCPSAVFHTDATQAVGKISIDLQENWSDVDMLSFSAHKFHGPKGVGGLYFRSGLELTPLLLGGGQEHGLRSGTTNTPGLAGLAAAARGVDLCAADKIASLRDQFEAHIKAALPVSIHSSHASRLPNTSCFSIQGILGDELAQSLAGAGIIVGTGSACSSGATQPPKTLLAMGVNYQTANSSIRVSLSSETTFDELLIALETLTLLNKELCSFSK